MTDQKALKANCDEFMDQLGIAGTVLSQPELFVVAIQYGLGPSEDQSLGEWVADTIDQARRRIARNSALGTFLEPESGSDPGTAENIPPVSGGPQ